MDYHWTLDLLCPGNRGHNPHSRPKGGLLGQSPADDHKTQVRVLRNPSRFQGPRRNTEPLLGLKSPKGGEPPDNGAEGEQRVLNFLEGNHSQAGSRISPWWWKMFWECLGTPAEFQAPPTQRSPKEVHSPAEITDFLFHDHHNCATADHPCRRDEAEFRSKSKRRKFVVRAGILRLTTRFTGLLGNPRATRKQHREGHTGAAVSPSAVPTHSQAVSLPVAWSPAVRAERRPTLRVLQTANESRMRKATADPALAYRAGSRIKEGGWTESLPPHLTVRCTSS
ncbi:unnamed protein product [Pleuronectes platessa]|uniref:Uncharacterized protein n=1 Tax=Pleuronectes platessa TaxID=8262 RepID=A0A9N7YW83_PLEPL|nr:unnamed protein product [Pleuronectes platessa]